ncbi:MAG: type I-F CRISPR-associated endoribonuclease Cas6/Csy4 [Chlamydiota bacterium]
MKYYIEICLLPDPEFPSNVLMNELFSKLHLVLAKDGNGETGVSFPQAGKTLGDTLRLHGSQGGLEHIMNSNLLRGLTDYVEVSAIMQVPSSCKHRCVTRIHCKSSVERLYRRSVKNGRLTVEEAREKIRDSKEQRSKLPFVQMKSHSSGQTFYLFIQQGDLLESPQKGAFSSYGLSKTATVPWF